MQDFIGRFQSRVSRDGAKKLPNPMDLHAGHDRKLVQMLSKRRMPTVSQAKYLPRYLSPKEKNTARWLISVIVVCVLAMGGKYINDNMSVVPADGGDYVEASVGNPRYVNPVLASGNDADNDIIELVFSGLMRTNVDGELVPDLAEQYEISEDGTTYTFHLREGEQWHDGHDLTADDVVATVGYIKNPGWKSPLASQFKNVAVEAPDAHTVVFSLHEPFAPFLSLCTFGVLPRHRWDEIGGAAAARAELNLKPIGSGPFKFKSYDKDKKGVIHTYTLARNANYYGTKPHLSTVSFRYYDGFDSAHDALIKRQVDGISYLPFDFRDTVDKVRSLRAITLHLPQYTAVFLNEKRNPTLRTKEVRQALTLSVDREVIRRAALGDDGVVVTGPILEGFVGYSADRKGSAYDVAAAKKVLDDAGWAMQDDGIRAKKGVDDQKNTVMNQLEITLTTVDSKEYKAAAEAIQTAWQAIGVKVTLDVIPPSRIQREKIRTHDYDALLYGEIVGSDPDPYPFWHSSQAEEGGLNLSAFSNRRVDELLEKGRTAVSADERAKMYGEFQDLLAADYAAVFLYSPTYTYAMSKEVQGVDESMIYSPADRFTGVWNWYVKTGRAWKK